MPAEVDVDALEANYVRALKAYVLALVNAGIQRQTNEPTDQEQSRDQGVHSGGGRSGGPFNPRQ
jgi:hypothetical protein